MYNAVNIYIMFIQYNCITYRRRVTYFKGYLSCYSIWLTINNFVFTSTPLQASSLQLDNPILSDYANARTVWEYDTDLESNEPWVDAGDSIDKTLDNLQQFSNTKLQKQTVI